MNETFEAISAADRSPHGILRAVFGYGSFRGLQEPAIQHVLDGGDALVLMPTGGGKSICYQVPALVLPGTAIIISPLIALMDDQVAALRQVGVRAGALHSDLDPAEARSTGMMLDEGDLDLLYVSPERLLLAGTIARLQRQRISLIAIDEAHCVSQWGHEFRPEYRQLAQLPDLFPGVRRIALTATADVRTRTDILQSLGMEEAAVFAASFHRPNLHIETEPKVSETGQLKALLGRHPDAAGIVYCGSRAKTERIAAWLNGHGHPAVAFHAGLPSADKRQAAGRFRSGESLTVVATIAFGMGIDRPDVRFVAHLDMPDSPEAYYQQIGRAGRDGGPSDTLLLYGGEDIARARYFLQTSAAPDEQKQSMRARLESMISLTETVECRTRALLRCFGEELGGPCGHCDNCERPARQFDGSVEAQKVLSAVYRTGQRFGATHIVSVLLGKSSEAAIKWGHDQLPTWGIGGDRSKDFWRSVIRQLIAIGALDVETGEFATLHLVPERARPILRGEAPVMLREEAPPPSGRAGSRVRGKGRPEMGGEVAAGGLFEALRQWRSGEAKSQGVPPYLIFHDATLQEIAAVRPRDLGVLGDIKGVGASKLLRYGPAILAVIEAS